MPFYVTVKHEDDRISIWQTLSVVSVLIHYIKEEASVLSNKVSFVLPVMTERTRTWQPENIEETFSPIRTNQTKADRSKIVQDIETF